MNISIITFTENGTKLAEKIRQAFACLIFCCFLLFSAQLVAVFDG